MSGAADAGSLLNEICLLGVGISLDDFGTGYSSLSYLLKLPFDVIKIDRSFVQGIATNPNSAELLRMILELAKNLHKAVVAEGVETVEQMELLRSMNCDLLQGYLFSAPIAPDLVDALLARHEQIHWSMPHSWTQKERCSMHEESVLT